MAAIREDDFTRMNDLLAAHPGLAREGRVAAPSFDPVLGHWIYRGDTALHAAAAGYRVEMAELLLAAGAEAGAAWNHRRGQPLHYAADGTGGNPAGKAPRQVAMIQRLLQSGADINAQDKNGATPLHRAVRTRSAAAVQCLLAAGADPLLRNQPGSTPFHLAVQNTGRGGSGTAWARAAQKEIIGWFLAHGVSPGLRDATGKSVRDWARTDWVRELLGHGRD